MEPETILFWRVKCPNALANKAMIYTRWDCLKPDVIGVGISGTTHPVQLTLPQAMQLIDALHGATGAAFGHNPTPPTPDAAAMLYGVKVALTELEGNADPAVLRAVEALRCVIGLVQP